ncbi:hypothetical protein C8Q79DRAFT_1014143 [Trametes meyenii]|nr:hypothetical protein C8Q79DRAFT_1014143 [Trametes meyenii]
MPVNTTVSHVSPLFNYIPRSAWTEATIVAPSPSSSSLTHHTTNATSSGSNASLTFSFVGTGIWVYGGYRVWQGPYVVTLDGDTTHHEGFTGGQEQYTSLLFAASGLPSEKHTLRIVNNGSDPARPVLDIDYLVFESNLTEAAVVDHNSSVCTWTPADAKSWDVDAASHTTWLGSGTMGLKFNHTFKFRVTVDPRACADSVYVPLGSGIAIYGLVDGDSAPFSVTIDGDTSHPLIPNTAQSGQTNQSTLLYVRTDLFDGPHDVWVENNPLAAGVSATKMSISHMRVMAVDRDTVPLAGNGNTTEPDGPHMLGYAAPTSAVPVELA